MNDAYWKNLVNKETTGEFDWIEVDNKKQLLTHEAGMAVYTEVAAALVKPCQKIAVAGSLRRGKTTVKDVEVVCIPEPFKDLLGNEFFTADRIKVALWRLRYDDVSVKGGDKYMNVLINGKISVDVFVTTPGQWGVIYAIRTGSADFSKWLVTDRQHGGALPKNYKVKDGWLWYKNAKLETKTELEFFHIIGIKYVDPEKREVAPWGKTEFYTN